jgi:hypothetical protein
MIRRHLRPPKNHINISGQLTNSAQVLAAINLGIGNLGIGNLGIGTRLESRFAVGKLSSYACIA